MKYKLKDSKKQNVVNMDDSHQELFNKLKKLRSVIASNKSIAPFMVLHDSTLHEMIQAKPKKLKDMLDIDGIGMVKLETYGEKFLDLIKQHESKK